MWTYIGRSNLYFHCLFQVPTSPNPVLILTPLSQGGSSVVSSTASGQQGPEFEPWLSQVLSVHVLPIIVSVAPGPLVSSHHQTCVRLDTSISVIFLLLYYKNHRGMMKPYAHRDVPRPTLRLDSDLLSHTMTPFYHLFTLLHNPTAIY